MSMKASDERPSSACASLRRGDDVSCFLETGPNRRGRSKKPRRRRDPLISASLARGRQAHVFRARPSARGGPARRGFGLVGDGGPAKAELRGDGRRVDLFRMTAASNSPMRPRSPTSRCMPFSVAAQVGEHPQPRQRPVRAGEDEPRVGDAAEVLADPQGETAEIADGAGVPALAGRTPA